jgi:hypothetical protein
MKTLEKAKNEKIDFLVNKFDVKGKLGEEFIRSSFEDYNLFISELIKKETDIAKKEGKERREKEIFIMMDECEKKGWSFVKFITLFAILINKK